MLKQARFFWNGIFITRVGESDQIRIKKCSKLSPALPMVESRQSTLGKENFAFFYLIAH
jgi:hypothetical protein